MSTAAPASTDRFEIGGRVFTSRLIIGTGKYRTFDEMKAAHRASGAQMVTVAVRRVPLDRSSESFLDHLEKTSGRRLSGRDAFGRANWIRAGHSKSCQSSHYAGATSWCHDHRGRGSRYSERCGDSNGTGSRWSLNEYGYS